MEFRNSRFNLKCQPGEEVTIQIVAGTVEQAALDLDGQSRNLRKGQTFSFEVQGTRRLTVGYPFQTDSGNFYTTVVKGSAGGDVSVDFHMQLPEETFKARRYLFSL